MLHWKAKVPYVAAAILVGASALAGQFGLYLGFWF
jgi:hypothetical protein